MKEQLLVRIYPETSILYFSHFATVALHCYNIRATHATNKQMQLVRATIITWQSVPTPPDVFM